ncbi:MAG: hypothetical protein PHT07_07410 [Paludibacter sp.]|nr:hypothetical protein [Paludibacter sp.]
MEKPSKYLPTPEMQVEFEQYKNLKTEAERINFQENRAKRLENLSNEERTEYASASLAGLHATVQAAEEIILATKLGEFELNKI